MPLRFSISAKSPRGDFSTKSLPEASTHMVEVALEGGEIVFGRALGSTIELPFPKISARHLRFFREAGRYRVEDLGSANGTRLAGRRLAAYAPESIAIGEVVEIGGIEVRFEGETAGPWAADAGAGTTTLARRLVHDIFEACPPSECARVTVISGPAAGQELVVSASGRVFKLGRGEGCDLVLPDEDVSREHATIERGDSGIVVCDLGSKNGVEVEGERVVGRRCLRDGDILRVGGTRLRLVDPEDRYLRQMEAADAGLPRAEVAPALAATMGQGGAGREAVGHVPSNPHADTSGTVRPSRLPMVAATIAVTVLVLALGVVLALALTV